MAQAAPRVNILDAFPSKYLRPDDLGRAAPVVTIDAVRIEMVGSRRQKKPVVYFVGKSKGMILNKTNATAIATLLRTKDTDAWRGGRVRLYVTETKFGDDMVACIRVKAAIAAVPQREVG